MAEAKKEAEKKKVEEKVETHKEQKTAEKPKAEKKEKKEEKKKVDIVSETVYTVPLRLVYKTNPNYKRSSKAGKMLKAFIKRHTKSDKIKVEEALNHHIWARGSKKPPRVVQVKAVKDSEGVVTVSLVK